ncbi:hypothetical protein ACMU_18445 [Actibacterium mucosum KCTC 23349]|uniref:Dihydrodipicolinate synthetase n=1 Tax=Actibacterium mucosum KCTC 23349 TaxID=1454373 RepID=A0A037ZFP9_9RHOB|nr:dihydrodipicolinate synthase family protein [Actibacterium mucosum]KAJ54408.1 hypothetical protein ACMU_18445 [Actibacterium mucosum KCTC 23349]
MANSLRGVLPIVPTPFRADGSVDLSSLGRLVEFAVGRGASGVVYPGVASEDVQLTTDERQEALETVVRVAGSRLPVLAGVNAGAPEEMVALARIAAETGVSGAMAMAIPAMGGETEAWFHKISDALNGGTIILQNLFAPRGADLNAAQMLDLARNVPAIRYVKEEGVPSGHKVSQLVGGADGILDGIIGGGGARYLFEELERGAIATMPAIELLELHVALLRAYGGHNRARAMEIYERTLPLLLVQAPFRMRMTKLILKHRGLIETDIVREKLPEMDAALQGLVIEFYEKAMSVLEMADA